MQLCSPPANSEMPPVILQPIPPANDISIPQVTNNIKSDRPKRKMNTANPRYNVIPEIKQFRVKLRVDCSVYLFETAIEYVKEFKG
jgi:hypothetical protein